MKLYKTNIWNLQITKITYIFLLGYIYCNIWVISRDVINWSILLWLNVICIAYFITTPLIHYFYIGLNKEFIMFNNRYLFSFKRIYRYDEIAKIKVWYPSNSGQIAGFRIYGAKIKFNYYSVGLVKHSDLDNIIKVLMESGVLVEVVSKNKNIVK